ncbi:Elongation factor P [Picochlorum sp. SENEW3]|nr:Elongation factor P [Picochlorum sp. SENEW3]
MHRRRLQQAAVIAWKQCWSVGPEHAVPCLSQGSTATNLAADEYYYAFNNTIWRRWAHQKKQANDIRTGQVISLQGGKQLVRVTKYAYTQGQGRQLGSVLIEAKDVSTHVNVPLRFKTKDMVDVVRMEEKKYQYLYREEDTLHFMHPESFEQVTVDVNMLDTVDLLKEGDDALLEFYENTLISVSLPQTVSLMVSEAAPQMKNATAAPQYKKVRLETGAEITAPAYIKVGDVCIVDTSTREFVKRASSSSSS